MPASLAIRARDLVAALARPGGGLPEKSCLAKAYIDGDEDGRKRAERRASKQAQKDKASGKKTTGTAAKPQPPPLKSLQEIVGPIRVRTGLPAACRVVLIRVRILP